MTKNVSLKLTKNVRSDQKRQPCAEYILLKNSAFGKILARRLLEERQDESQSKKRPLVKYITGFIIFRQMPKNILFFT